MPNKIDSYKKLQLRFGDYVQLPMQDFLNLSYQQIEEIEQSCTSAVKRGELKDLTRIQRTQGKGLSLLEQACQARGWDNPNKDSDDYLCATKII
jgi:hypothetical protein